MELRADEAAARPPADQWSSARVAALRASGLLGEPPLPGFQRITRIVARQLQTPVALCTLVDENRQVFKAQVGLGEPWATLGETDLDHSFCQHVANADRTLAIADARLHPLVKDNLAIPDLQVVAYLGAPLRLPSGEAVGALCAIAPSPRSWSRAEVEALEDLAALITAEVERWQHVRLRAAELARLQGTQNMLAMAEQAANGGHFTIVSGDRDVQLSPGARAILHLPHDHAAVTLARLWRGLTPEVRRDLRAARRRLRELPAGDGGHHTIATEMAIGDGAARRWIDIRGKITRGGDGRYRVAGIVHDITAFRQAERDLRRRNTMFDLVLDNMRHALVFFDADRRLVVANRRYAELYCLPPEAIRPGTTLETILALREAAGTAPCMGNAAYLQWVESLRHAGAGTTTVRLADGRDVEIHYHGLDDGGWISTIEDITERSERDRALRESEAKLRLITENTSDVIVVGHLNGKRVYFSPAVTRVLGYTPEEALRTPMRDWVHPDDMADVFASTRALSPSNPTTERVFRLRHKDGTYIWAEIASRWAEDHDGQICIVSSVRDVSRRMLAEAEQRQLFENAIVGLFRMDLEGRFLRVNNAMVNLAGVADEATFLAMLADPAQRRAGLHDDPERMDALLQTIRREGAVRDFIMPVRRVDTQESLWVSVNAWVSRDANGNPVAIDGAIADITERFEAQARIGHMARHDPLTDLFNRAGFQRECEGLIREAALADETVHLLFLDLDRFKELNDTMGHAAGDALLCEVAARLQMLAGNEAVIGRVGGDEFALALARPPDQNVEAFAIRMICALNRPMELGESRSVEIGISLGLASAPGKTADLTTLMRQADLAMYRAKRDGRSSYRQFEPALEEAQIFRITLERGLKRALAQDELFLRYQPLLDLRSGRISGFEALLRWRDPDRGMVSPGDFIPIAEDSKLIVPIGAKVLLEACSMASRWPTDLKVAVNVSAVQLRDPHFISHVDEALSRSRLDPRRLELEVTESVLLADGAETLATLRLLRARGIRIALDDFGTGFSSLSYLLRHPFDKLKIDRSFTSEIGSPETGAIVRAIITMGSRLGMRVTAEGVEHVQQRVLLESYGCHELQGYMIGVPLDPPEVMKLVASERAAA